MEAHWLQSGAAELVHGIKDEGEDAGMQRRTAACPRQSWPAVRLGPEFI